MLQIKVFCQVVHNSVGAQELTNEVNAWLRNNSNSIISESETVTTAVGDNRTVITIAYLAKN